MSRDSCATTACSIWMPASPIWKDIDYPLSSVFRKRGDPCPRPVHPRDHRPQFNIVDGRVPTGAIPRRLRHHRPCLPPADRLQSIAGVRRTVGEMFADARLFASHRTAPDRCPPPPSRPGPPSVATTTREVENPSNSIAVTPSKPPLNLYRLLPRWYRGGDANRSGKPQLRCSVKSVGRWFCI